MHIRPGCRGLQLGCSCIRNAALQQHIHNDGSTSADVPASVSTPQPHGDPDLCVSHAQPTVPSFGQGSEDHRHHCSLYSALCEDKADVIVLLLCGLELISAQGGNLLLVHASFLTHSLSSSTHSKREKREWRSIASNLFCVRLSPEPK